MKERRSGLGIWTPDMRSLAHPGAGPSSTWMLEPARGWGLEEGQAEVWTVQRSPEDQWSTDVMSYWAEYPRALPVPVPGLLDTLSTRGLGISEHLCTGRF